MTLEDITMSPKPIVEELELRVEEIEQALQKIESRFNDAQRIAHIGSWEVFPGTEELFWSDEQFRILGYEPSEIIPSFDLAQRHIHPDDLSAYMKKRDAALTEKCPYDIEFRIVRKDGAVRHLHSIANVELDTKGNIIRRNGTLQDITDQKRIRDALRENETRLKTAQRIGSIGSWDLDLKTRKRFWSDEMFRIFGYKPGEIEPGDTLVQSHLHPDDKDRYLKLHEIALRERNKLDWEFRIVRKDGAVRVCHLIAEVVRDQAANPVRYFGTFQDITEHKQVEDELRKSESRLNAAQQIAHLGSWDRNLETGEKYWSEEEFRIYGYEPDEVAPSLELVRSHVHPDDIEKFGKVREADFYGQDAYSQEYRIIRKDGAVRTVNSVITVERDQKGKGKRYFGIIQDVTEQKAMEQALRDSELEYRSTLDAIGDAIHVIDEAMCLILENEVFKKWRNALGLRSKVIGSNIFEAYPFLDERVRQEYEQVFKTGKPLITEEEYIVKDQRIITETRKFPIYINEKVKKIVTVVHDISRRKHMELALQKSYDELDSRVKERTRELEIKTKNLEEVNTALGVLIKKRDEDKAELEESIRANSMELVLPYAEKLENTPLDDRQKAYLSILVSNLNDIISPFSNSLINGYRKLSSSEIQVSDLIKHGKRTKEIAGLLSLSTRTVESHRKNIRRKLGLSNKRANLRSHLMSMQ
jgi:PAS domain S-box-containing protein